MQDIHSICGGRIYSGGGGSGGSVDRRLRPHNHHHNLQALKCPRCDSLNTKFCYYNNYNLSQPRHFCKGCRRYWTKGGVLRNVPVGGGCRKTKRSPKVKPNSEAVVVASSVDRNRSQSHSSSESSSLTATATAAAATTEAVSAPPSSVPDLKLFKFQSENQNFETSLLDHGSDCGIFSEIGSFTNLITSANDELMFGINNNISDISQIRLNEENQWQNHQQHQEKVSIIGDELKMQEITDNGLLGFGSLDQGMFDLSTTVDHAYWSQNQWTDQDESNLYLP